MHARVGQVKNYITAMSIVAVATMVSGCIPFAWALPPAQIEAGVAPRVQPPDDGDSESDVDVVFPFRASFQPLHLFPSLATRYVDVGVGYQFIPASNGPFLYGPSLELALLYARSFIPPEDGPARDATVPRFGLRAKVNGLYASARSGPMNPAGTLQLSVEWFGFHDNPLSGCQVNEDEEDDDGDPLAEDEPPSVTCVSGLAYGESSVGFFVEGSMARFDDLDQWWVGAGVLLRMPASMGVGVVMGDIF